MLVVCCGLHIRSHMTVAGICLQAEAGDAERAETWFADMEAAGFKHDLQAGHGSDGVLLLHLGLLPFLLMGISREQCKLGTLCKQNLQGSEFVPA